MNTTNSNVQQLPWQGDDDDWLTAIPIPDRNPIVRANHLPTDGSSDWLVDGVIPRKGLGLLYGATNSGKSFVVQDLLAHIGQGLVWPVEFAEIGHPDPLWAARPGDHDDARNVVYIAAEGAAGLSQRFQAWKKSRNWGDLGGLHVLPRPVDFGDPVEVTQLLAWMAERFRYEEPVAMVVIDTLAATLAGRDENSAAGMGAYLAGVRRLIDEVGCFVLLVHHPGHGDQDRARGWSGLRAALDVEMSLSEFSTGGLVLECTKMRDGKKFEPIPLFLQPLAGSLVVMPGSTASAPRLTPSEQKALDVLANRPDVSNGVSTGEWESASGIPSFYRVRNSLERKGLVLNVGVKGRPKWTLTSLTFTDITPNVSSGTDTDTLTHPFRGVSDVSSPAPAPIEGSARGSGRIVSFDLRGVPPAQWQDIVDISPPTAPSNAVQDSEE